MLQFRSAPAPWASHQAQGAPGRPPKAHRKTCTPFSLGVLDAVGRIEAIAGILGFWRTSASQFQPRTPTVRRGGGVVRFQTRDASMTRLRTAGKAVERPMPLGRPGGE
jgi:hypothetical protein